MFCHKILGNTVCVTPGFPWLFANALKQGFIFCLILKSQLSIQEFHFLL